MSVVWRESVWPGEEGRSVLSPRRLCGKIRGGIRQRSFLSKFRARLRTVIKHLDQVVNAAFKRFGKPEHHREARHLHAAFEVADERVTRTAAFGELSLRQITREAK